MGPQEKRKRKPGGGTVCSPPANTGEGGPDSGTWGAARQSPHEGASVSAAPRRPSGLCAGAPTHRPRVTLSAPPATSWATGQHPAHSVLCRQGTEAHAACEGRPARDTGLQVWLAAAEEAWAPLLQEAPLWSPV